ncbi:hypothetical protein DAPPUDRAFT_108785 [Daphnia pulex]|uniref:Uncharacterized protein n=1 Tax=Daphnia pulex TaxID=6669 RepID=E9H161_DAPPU|nr:hypothetical protein DAPPUDRAFT_108785 [Daphnia pulex]|eukprot:EFX74581.1 hypothetical protein DAPPUDRAFT_108785 [Daphnia pulex]
MAASVPAGRIKQDSDMETIRYLLEDGQDISAMTWGEDETNAIHVAAANEYATTPDLIDTLPYRGFRLSNNMPRELPPPRDCCKPRQKVPKSLLGIMRNGFYYHRNLRYVEKD